MFGRVCISQAASSMTWDKRRKEHARERKEGLAAQSVQLTLVLIKFYSPFASIFLFFFLLFSLCREQWTVMSQDEEERREKIIVISACLSFVVIVERWLL